MFITTLLMHFILKIENDNKNVCLQLVSLYNSVKIYYTIDNGFSIMKVYNYFILKCLKLFCEHKFSF